MSLRQTSTMIMLTCSLALPGCAPSSDPPAELVRSVSPADRVQVSPDSDPRAIEIAQTVMERMGGWENWDRTRYVSWKFFGGRKHVWDRQTGDVRIEAQFPQDDAGSSREMLFLMNVETKQGRAWENGAEIVDPSELREALSEAHEIWINDSYWMFMPYKLLDPGVRLRYLGERPMVDARAADVLELTFSSDAGYTPDNRYEVFVARDSGLVEAWSFFANATDAEPRFTLPWSGWSTFGSIKLATSHGRDKDWAIAVMDELPRAVFESPEPAG